MTIKKIELGKKAGVIALIGRPNSGKSTLLNALLAAQISIVSPKAQTTREQVLGILTEKRGQILFLDTPGIHRAQEGGINEFMVAEAKQALDDPNAIWYLVDPYSSIYHEMAVIELLTQINHSSSDSEKSSPPPVFLLLNKADRARNLELAVEIETEFEKRGYPVFRRFEISALKKTGLANLLGESWQKMPVGEPFYPDPEQLSDRPTRFFVAEQIRRQLFLCLGEELPYSCAIQIENFNEKVTPPRIEASICVERDSQKGMVIGKGGQKIKEIGQAARAEIERFLGVSIFLGLKVKVLKDWTRDAQQLKKMGYTLPQSRSSENKKLEGTRP